MSFTGHVNLRIRSLEDANKGDVPGHEFHGNQYGGGGTAEGNLAERASTGREHEASAKYHAAAARSARGDGDKAGEHFHAQASQAHHQAARADRERWAGARAVSENARAASAHAHVHDAKSPHGSY